jgi:hypothetical protein
MCPRIHWELVADPVGFAELPLGTIAVGEWLYSNERSDSSDEFCGYSDGYLASIAGISPLSEYFILLPI